MLCNPTLLILESTWASKGWMQALDHWLSVGTIWYEMVSFTSGLS